MTTRETENNAYAKYQSDQQRVLWYAMVFSGMVNFNFHTEDRFTDIIADEGCGRGICYYETQTLQNTKKSAGP